MTSDSANKRRRASAKPRSASVRVLTLEAPIEPPDSGEEYAPGPTEFAGIMDVTERTLRSWAEYGLPHRKDGSGRVTYPFPEAYTWARCWRWRMKVGYRAAPLALEDAVAWDLEEQRKLDKGGWWVLVPLDWNHPRREEQLRKAAAGREWRGHKLVELTPEEVAAGEVGEA